jgi:hypothetical protein
MRCKDCSQVRGYPYKRSHLVALRPNKISALDRPSTWWRQATFAVETFTPPLSLHYLAVHAPAPKSRPQALIAPNAPNVRILPRANVFESDGTLPSGDTTKRPRDTDGHFQELPCYS